MSAIAYERTRTLEIIDLTEDEPIISTEEVKEKVPVINLGDENANEIKSINDRKRPKCEICNEEISKYTCPGCRMKTCCLACSTKHKKMTGCTGQRDIAKYVPKIGFNNLHLLSDYRFLEEGNRLVDNAHRDKSGNRSYEQRPKKREQLLQNGAKKSEVLLFRMSKGMKKRRENRSFYNTTTNVLHWTIKFIFDDVNKDIFYKPAEDEVLETVLQQYLDKNHKEMTPEHKVEFSPYIKCHEEKKVDVYFTHDLDAGTDNLRYVLCDVKDTFQNILKGKAILEYPVFHVVLPATSEKLSKEIFRKETFISPSASETSESSSDVDSSSSSESENENEYRSPPKKSKP